MQNRIKLLSDSVANQIAAGEVVQRPASVVKELLENALDAESKSIILNVKDAGRTLIQVVDDGIGMSEIDARMSIERHATSKISVVDDIFKLKTMGFRGEAMASITAVSQAEIKSKTEEDELAVVIKLNGNDVVSQDVENGKTGTSISVKNLFFNVPARRNFLKSNNIENRHITETFQQIALTRPDVAFKFFSNGNEVYHLEKSNLKQRILQLFGKRFEERLVPINESTDIVEIKGFVGKPEFATAKKGEQFFFVNDRFIKMPYLHHAVMQAFEDLLSKDSFPQYFIYLYVDPAQIDVNIHPTKTEVKFLEEKAIYAILRTAIRQSLGKFNIAPTLDFDRETAFDIPAFDKRKSIQIPSIQVDKNFNPFDSGTVLVQKQQKAKDAIQYGNDLYEIAPATNTERQSNQLRPSRINTENELEIEKSKLIQLHNRFILTQLASGFMIIDQYRAHQRVLFEEILAHSHKNYPSQQLLFPVLIQLSKSDMAMIMANLEVLNKVGFSIEPFGKDTISINGAPSGCEESELKGVFMGLIDDLQSDTNKNEQNLYNRLAQILSKRMAIQPGRKLSDVEMADLADRLFACEMPYSLPNGKPVVITLSLEELNKKFLS